VGAAFLRMLCPQCTHGMETHGFDGPTWRKAPLPGDSKGQQGRLCVEEPVSDPQLTSSQCRPSWRSPRGGPPQRPDLFPRRQGWDVGFSEHFPSVYHSSEVCDVRPLMDASIHRLDIMMYREPRDI